VSPEFKIASTTHLLDSYVFGVERRTVSHAGQNYDRDVVTHPGGVAILALNDLGEIGIIRQWRAPFDDYLWEIPAGTQDVEGEEPIETAKRELLEELGCSASQWTLLGRFMVSAGWTDQVMTIFEARNLTMSQRHPEGPEESTASVHWFSPSELRENLRREPAIESTLAIALHRVFGTFFDDR
jgi:8-oxo-dGTP pyrophosphatase MutT (NUDIX family)